MKIEHEKLRQYAHGELTRGEMVEITKEVCANTGLCERVDQLLATINNDTKTPKQEMHGELREERQEYLRFIWGKEAGKKATTSNEPTRPAKNWEDALGTEGLFKILMTGGDDVEIGQQMGMLPYYNVRAALLTSRRNMSEVCSPLDQVLAVMNDTLKAIRNQRNQQSKVIDEENDLPQLSRKDLLLIRELDKSLEKFDLSDTNELNDWIKRNIQVVTEYPKELDQAGQDTDDETRAVSLLIGVGDWRGIREVLHGDATYECT